MGKVNFLGKWSEGGRGWRVGAWAGREGGMKGWSEGGRIWREGWAGREGVRKEGEGWREAGRGWREGLAGREEGR